MFPTEAPYPIFSDLKGSPLDNGYLYFGEANKNPETDPIDIYWDAAGTIPAAQPVRTNGGYPARNGTPAKVYVAGDYSLTSRDKNGKFVYSSLSESFVNALASSSGASFIGILDAADLYTATTVEGALAEIASSVVYDIDNIAALKLYEGLYEGQQISLKGYYSDNDGGGDLFYWDSTSIETANDGTIVKVTAVTTGRWKRIYIGDIYPEWFGAKGDKVTDDTTAIQAALDLFATPLGGVVRLNPARKYVVTSLNIPVNVSLLGTSRLLNQDEGSVYGYDEWFGGLLFVSGTITMDHGSIVGQCAILETQLNGYTIPATDGAANALVAAFTGTAITITGTGTRTHDLLILGFDYAIVDSGNRHRVESVHFDCTNGITLGGGSDVSRVKDCHGWPYLTAELGLSISVNYRSGVAYLQQNNADSYLHFACYCFGYEVGFRTLGASGNVVQSPNYINCRADSGAIGASGTSIGFDIGAFTAYPELINPEAQGNDINFKNSTQGADIGGGERLNRTLVTGGKFLEAHDRFCVIDNGRVSFMGTTFGKGSTSTAVFDWNTADGGSIISCDFEEMYSASGAGLVFDPANTTVSANVKRFSNFQKTTIHADNRMRDTAASSEERGVAVSISPDANGEYLIPHNLGKTPVYAEAHIRGDITTTAVDVISVDGTNIKIRFWLKGSGADQTTGSYSVYWKVEDDD